MKAALLWVLGAFVCATPAGAATSGAEHSITSADLLRHVRYFADDRLEGRESGGPGNPEATDYVATQFQRYGLKPAGGADSLLQPFEIKLNAELGEACRLIVRVKEERRELRLGEEYLPFDNVDEGRAFGPLVFAGFGITATEEAYDDYAGLNVSNKVVLMLRRTPDADRENSRFKEVKGRPNTHALFTTKLQNARRHGARGILIVDATKERKTVAEMSDGGPWRMGGEKDSLPFAFVSYELAADWLKTAGRNLDELVKQFDERQQPESFAMPSILVDLNVEIRRESATVSNVIGLLEGADPELKHEYLVVGGHHDHVGYGRDRRNRGNADFIHNGADDNASGAAAVLELAQAFTQSKQRPRRSLLFMTFNAEERGLLGSRHYVDHPLLPLTNTVAMFNLDMVGRGASGLDVGGVGTSPGFKAMVLNTATNFDLKVSTTPGGKAPSDNTSFYNKGLPVLFFYTGRHDDYHKPSDDWEKIDAREIESVTRLAYRLVDQVANAPERPRFTKSDGNPTRRGRPRLLLGVTVDTSHRGAGVRVESVMEDLPAGGAGVREGDVIRELNGRPVNSVGDIGRVLSTLRAGQEVPAKLLRGGKELALKVQF